FAGATMASVALGIAAALALAWRFAQPAAAAAPVMAAGVALPPVAEPLTPLPKAVRPSKVWVVETGEGWEQYSNGLRIDTTYSVAGEPRRYRNFDEQRGMLEDVGSKPVGIMYHTSESDIWPMEESNNEKL